MYGPMYESAWPDMQMARLWTLLRGSILHYLRAQNPEHPAYPYTAAARTAAPDDLREYANSLQQLVRSSFVRIFAAQSSYQAAAEGLPALPFSCSHADIRQSDTMQALPYTPAHCMAARLQCAASPCLL